MHSLDVELDEWQKDVVLAGMGRDRAGKWVADEVAQIVPRQNGKSWPLYTRVLWGVRNGEKLIRWTAHEFKTSAESYYDLRALCEHDEMADLAPKFYVSNGKEAIHFNNKCRVSFIARSKASGRGMGSDLIVLDEALMLEDKHMSALKSTQAARKAPQIWYASSAPLEDSPVLRRVCIVGRSGDASGLCYLEWCASDDAEPDDPRAWAVANPAMGTRLTESFTRSEMTSLKPEDFIRERLGIWFPEALVVSVFPRGAWAACVDENPKVPKGATFALAIDVDPERTRASIGAASLMEDGRIAVEVLDDRPGVNWLVDEVADFVTERKHKPAVLVNDAGQSKTFIAPLEAAEVEVTRIDASEMVAACGIFHDRVLERRLVHLNQPELNSAVTTAVKRELGDAWAWSRRRSGAAITPLVACSLALFGVATAKPKRKLFVLTT